LPNAFPDKENFEVSYCTHPATCHLPSATCNLQPAASNFGLSFSS